jgi:hypothetical protein
MAKLVMADGYLMICPKSLLLATNIYACKAATSYPGYFLLARAEKTLVDAGHVIC